MMFELYTIMLALCGQPKMKNCYIESLNCYKSGSQMKCAADVVIRSQNKISRKKIITGVHNGKETKKTQDNR